MEYSDNLRTYRIKKGISQEEMAGLLKLKNQQAYQYYEAGNLNARKAKQFSIILGTDLMKPGIDLTKAIPVILKYIAKAIAKEQHITEKAALKKLLDEIEMDKML